MPDREDEQSKSHRSETNASSLKGSRVVTALVHSEWRTFLEFLDFRTGLRVNKVDRVCQLDADQTSLTGSYMPAEK